MMHAGPAAPTTTARLSVRPLAPGEATVSSGLWFDRAQRNGATAIPAGLSQLTEAKNLHNFEVAAGRVEGDVIGPIFADSDVYKWLDAAAWEYGRSLDKALLAEVLRVVELIAAAQADDGYLDTVVQVREDTRYAKLEWSHEHYCAGHLFQAAIALVRASGHTELLDVAVKLADHLVATFGTGEGQYDFVDGHPVVEMGLVELYRETGTRAYLDLARYFVQARGHGMLATHGVESAYFSDRLPVREQTTVEGHAVRAVYLAAGAADVAIETGDGELLTALGVQYAAMERGKQYLTGGLGSRWEGESFGDPYELPADRGYAETCAAIGGVQWAWRMLLATGDPRFGDQIERMLYNGFLAGVSLAGTEYFYVNPLQLRSDAGSDENRSPAHGRRGWFACACCPPNVMRTLASFEGYLASSTGTSVQLHQYVPGRIADPRTGLTLDVDTDYPWQGTVRLRVVQAPGSQVELAVRVPAWATGSTLDGEPVAAGYGVVRRTWAVGDTLTLELPMEPRLTVADQRVDAVRGCVAIERGPLVYALEQVDQPDGVPVDDVLIDPSTTFVVEHDDDLLGGATVIKVAGLLAASPHDTRSPYRGASAPGDARDRVRDVELTAIPYH
ncbi:MAG: glycoside hydrolase family 127 protein, partial [Propionibacteriaceae bacterium]